MRNRLRNQLHWWISWCDSSFIISIIARGYWLPWKTTEPPPFETTNHAGVHAHTTFTREAIRDLITSGAATKVSSRTALSCISPLNVVEQRDKCRLILDLRKVNQHLQVPKFKYEGLNRVSEIIRRNDWLFTIDLKAGYHHVEMHPSCWKFLGFQFEGEFYCFRALPFGLATAPFVFTQLIKQLAKRWRACGVRVVPYVDDLLFLCDSAKQARKTCIEVLRDLGAAGFVINEKKSCLQPAHQTRFLGMELDTESGMFSIGSDRRAQFLDTLNTLISKGQRGQQVPIRQVARITGMLSSMSLALGTTARAFSHELLQLIDAAESWHSRIWMPRAAIEELIFWQLHFDQFNGAPFHLSHQFDAVIHVDASAHSWGATLPKFTDASYAERAPPNLKHSKGARGSPLGARDVCVSHQKRPRFGSRGQPRSRVYLAQRGVQPTSADIDMSSSHTVLPQEPYTPGNRMDPTGAKCPRGRTVKNPRPRRLLAAHAMVPPTGTPMGSPHD
ncbi:unnamed protein product [Closterium sp. NIES-54]